MANSSAKKLVKSNMARLATLRLAMLLTNVVYLARAALLRRSFTRLHAASWPALALLYGLPYYLLHTAARPRYFDDGQLMDGGEDISGPGLLEYAHDLMYVAMGAQVALAVTPWGLALLAVVPLYAVYAAGVAAWGAAVAPKDAATQAAAGEAAADADLAGLSRKERRKAEREARRGR